MFQSGQQSFWGGQPLYRAFNFQIIFFFFFSSSLFHDLIHCEFYPLQFLRSKRDLNLKHNFFKLLYLSCWFTFIFLYQIIEAPLINFTSLTKN